MKNEKKSASKEDYLKLIFEINVEQKQKVSSKKMAERLGVSPAAVTDMTKKLISDKLVKKEKIKGLQLTSSGEKIALGVIRKHRLWESFLVEVLKIPWGEVHKEAEMLEHNTSDFLIDKVDEYLGYPKFDPHGTPIPNKSFKLSVDGKEIKLADGEVSKKYCVNRIYDKDVELIKYFDSLKLKIGSEIELIERYSFDNSIDILLDGNAVHLSSKVSNSIFIK